MRIKKTDDTECIRFKIFTPSTPWKSFVFDIIEWPQVKNTVALASLITVKNINSKNVILSSEFESVVDANVIYALVCN